MNPPPLAERMRPRSLKDFIGQEKLIGPGKLLTESIKNGKVFSAIFWGPPGSGKTTLASIIASAVKATFIKISAVTSNVAEMKKIITEAEKEPGKTILFIDEIHRFNKAQQDVLLPHVEKGTIVLLGATTENPSFEIIGPLLSRSRVLVLDPLTTTHLKQITKAALKDKVNGLGALDLEIEKKALETLVTASAGDARFALNTLEICAELAVLSNNREVEQKKSSTSVSRRLEITNEQIIESIQRKMAQYDKQNDFHYDTISAFIKSMRAGQTDAALHYLARMIEAGEDPLFIARRMVIFASEDIGNAQPTALVLATASMQAVHMIGMPEASLILAQTASYLSEAPKSIASTTAIAAALGDVRNLPIDSIPLHLRNAPTKLMKDLGYGQGHTRYPWMNPEETKNLPDYLPKNLVGKKYYHHPKKT